MLVVRVESKGANTYDTPCTLDTEPWAGRAGGETAEAVGENPDWDECTDEENKYDKGRNECRGGKDSGQTHTMVRRRPICWLIIPAIAPPLQRMR